jgi:hypothetical protein
MAGETVDKQNIFGFNARFTLQVLGSIITFLSWWPFFKTGHKTYLPITMFVVVHNLKNETEICQF